MSAGVSSIVDSASDPPAARALRVVAEVLLLALVAFSPWPFASAPTVWEFVLRVGLAVLLALWAAHAIIVRRFSYTTDAVSVCLLGLVLLTGLQLVPLPVSVVRVLSPQLAEWHRTLRPEAPELLPGESDANVPHRSNWLPLSIDPATTQDFLAQLVAVFLAYAVTRNFVASKDSFRRLAWVGFVNGVLLAVLAVAQCTSGSRGMIYGQFPFDNQVFGPFVNKNHYADYVALCIGLGLALLLQAARRADGDYPEARSVMDHLRSPEVVGIGAGLGLMLASIPLSLSRGGLAAVLVAMAATGFVMRKVQGVRSLLIGLAMIALGLAVWFGMGESIARFGTVAQGTADNRFPLWREALPIAERFPLTGTGGGTLPRAEQAIRTKTVTISLAFNSAANEYYEAWIEGGIVRCALTVALAVAVIWYAVTGYRRYRNRSRGPLLLGGLFGLLTVSVHCIVDFAVHMPSVALLTAVVAAQVVAAASRNTSVSRDPQRSEGERATVRGPTAIGAAILVAVVGVLVAWAGWRMLQVERLRDAAYSIALSNYSDRSDRAIEYLEGALRLRPNDAELWSRLSAAHLFAAHERAAAPFIAVAGPLAAVDSPDTILPGDVGNHVYPALRAARTARDLNQLMAGPHLRLGLYSQLFTRTEPAAVHFERAKRVGGFDPDVWYLSGKAALNRGEEATAWADWRESLRRDPRRLVAVVRAARIRLTPEEIRDRILPDEPVLWVAATDELNLDAKARRAWLHAATNRWQSGHTPATEAEWIAWATTHENLGEADAAIRVWMQAVEHFPQSIGIRDRFAVRLEAEERYEDVVAHLEWLLAHQQGDGRVRVRLNAARHAIELKREIQVR